MRPPDQIPNRTLPQFKRGDDVYLWAGKSYSLKHVVSVHEWNGALTIEDGIGPMQVGGHQVISAADYKEEQREEARQRYAEIITHWNNGLRTSKEIAPLLKGEMFDAVSVRGCGQMIAAAKRWKLIADDLKP